jgi:hypothetical protein
LTNTQIYADGGELGDPPTSVDYYNTVPKINNLGISDKMRITDEGAYPIYDKNNKPWFLAKYITENLTYTNIQKVIKNIPDEFKLTLNQIVDISMNGMRYWFAQNLPYNILQFIILSICRRILFVD